MRDKKEDDTASDDVDDKKEDHSGNGDGNGSSGDDLGGGTTDGDVLSFHAVEMLRGEFLNHLRTACDDGDITVDQFKDVLNTQLNIDLTTAYVNRNAGQWAATLLWRPNTDSEARQLVFSSTGSSSGNDSFIKDMPMASQVGWTAITGNMNCSIFKTYL